MRSLFRIGFVVFVLMAVFALSGCEEQGPMEKTGEKIDQAVEETKEDLRQTKEKVEDAVKN